MKKFILILNFLIGITFTSFAQNKITADNGITQAKLIKFYPNPASAGINLDFQRGYNKTYSLQVYNFIGKLVLELKNLSPHTNINLEDFFRGIYIFQLRDKTGAIIESGKFQVIK
ncbi:MAG: T9SS type A sorting domain-containing protein [Ferruginibacter sp.]